MGHWTVKKTVIRENLQNLQLRLLFRSTRSHVKSLVTKYLVETTPFPSKVQLYIQSQWHHTIYSQRCSEFTYIHDIDSLREPIYKNFDRGSKMS